jgi:hypothetical protein
VNAAFLLMTTACLTGADAAPPAAPPPAAAPIHSVGTGGCAGGGCSSCGGCDTCGSCGCESEGFLSKLKAKFHRSSDCGCGCETESRFSKFSGHLHQSSCGYDTGCGGGCGSPCDACGGHSGGGLREKLRGMFHRGGDCGCETSCGCDTGCAGGGCGGVVSPLPGGTMPKEQLGAPKEAPKKLPSGDTKPSPDKEKKPGSVQLIPQPVVTPSLELAPTGNKSPF